jgi:hypothetical protein
LRTLHRYPRLADRGSGTRPNERFSPTCLSSGKIWPEFGKKRRVTLPVSA